MTRMPGVFLLACLAALFSAGAVGQETGSVLSLDELLRQVEQGRAGDAQEFKEREQRFIAARAEQRQLLQQATARKSEAEQRSEQLETTFEENEIRTSELTEALDRRLGSLKELFGVLQQVSGDTQAVLQSSLTSVQYPDRGAALYVYNYLSDAQVKSLRDGPFKEDAVPYWPKR